MRVFVHDTWITLTPDQIAAIEQTKADLEKCVGSFESLLKHYGLKKVDTSKWENHTGCLWYEHPDRNWCAEVIVKNPNWVECWAAGEYLKSTGFPGGHLYGEPEQLRDAFQEALRLYAIS